MALRPLRRDELPQELHPAYDRMRDALLRRRLLWLAGVYFVLSLAGAAMYAVVHLSRDVLEATGEPLPDPRIGWSSFAAVLLAGAVFLAAWKRWPAAVRALGSPAKLMYLMVAAPSWLTLVSMFLGAVPAWYECEPWLVGILAAFIYPWAVRESAHAAAWVAAGAIPAAVLFAVTDPGGLTTHSRAFAAAMMPVAALLMIGLTALIRRPRQREFVIDVLASAMGAGELPRADRWPSPAAVAGEYLRAAELRFAYGAEASQLFHRGFVKFLAICGGASVAIALARLISVKIANGREFHDLVLNPGLRGGADLRAMAAATVPFDLLVGTALICGSLLVWRTSATRSSLRPLSGIVIALAYCVNAAEGVRLSMYTPDVAFPLIICSVGLGLWMLAAALMLPWTIGDAARAAGLSVVAGGLTVYAAAIGFGVRLGAEQMMVLPIIAMVCAAPGIAAAALRENVWQRQFQREFVERRERELRDELTYARRLHEAQFPEPVTSGPLRMTFRYEPMRQIGGDFLFVSREGVGSPRESLSIVLLDVTGHGIPSALTVAQLSGELRRVFAENPGVRPGDVLCALNKYMSLTAANHAVYASAFCAKVGIDPPRMEYANAGHPPAFVRRVNGDTVAIDSTTFVLGVVGERDFDPMPAERPFLPGDCLVVYTDGAAEARDAHGRMLRTAGVRALVEKAMVGPPLMPEWILQAVRVHRSAAPEDDTLVAAVFRVPDAGQVVAAAPTGA